MAFAGSDSMYITLTSETNKDAFPDNKASQFSVQLGQQISLDPELWEVGLFSLIYPFSFITMPEDCFIIVRHGDRRQAKIEIPREHFASSEDLRDFVNTRLHKTLSPPATKKSDAPVKLHFDGMKRARFTFRDENSDIGFSPSAAYVFGFVDHPELSTVNLKRREKLRNLINSARNNNQPAGAAQISSASEDERRRRRLLTRTVALDIIPAFNPLHIYTVTFFVQFCNQANVDPEKLFELICRGIHNPFAETFQRGVPGDRYPQELSRSQADLSLQIDKIHARLEKLGPNDPQPPDLTEEILKVHALQDEIQRRVHEVTVETTPDDVYDDVPFDWFRESSFAELFELYDVRAFIRSFELHAGLGADRASSFEPGREKISKWYPYAVAACFFARFLQDLKVFHPSKITASRPALVNPFELIYVYGDFVKPEPFNDVMAPLLAIVRTEGVPGTATQYKPSGNIQYKRLQRANIGTMKIIIASDAGQPVPFLSEPAVVELHFRRRPVQRYG